MIDTVPLPEPAVYVLAGASGSGKSSWARSRFSSYEIVSSDELRAVVGSGPADLDASAEAFALLDQIVAGRIRRGLTTVIDTLGLDPVRRAGYLRLAHAAGLRSVLVIMDTAPALCRQRNRTRDRPVPAGVLTEQLRKIKSVITGLDDEDWDHVIINSAASEPAVPPVLPVPAGRSLDGLRTRVDDDRSEGPRLVLQISRFGWGDQPATWLRDIAVAADALGFHGIALMDHLIQIPQVDRAWEPIPEPWVTLGLLAGLDTRLRLGTLVSPVSFRAAGIIAKTAATLDALTDGRAFCGLGAGWWLREHQAYGLDFPADHERLDQLQATIETLRALWAPGTKAFRGRFVRLPETTCYPRPVGNIPIIVGGSGEQRTLRIVAEQADAANLRTDDALEHKIGVLHRHCAAVGRDPEEVEVTVLDLPVIGVDRADVARRVERLRGRTPAPAFAARHHAGTAVEHRRRYAGLAELGVRTVFVSLPDLVDADDLVRCAPLLDP